jgi:hypothetical protein
MHLSSRFKVGYVFTLLVISCLLLLGSTKLVTFAASEQLDSASSNIKVSSIALSSNCGTWNIIPSPSRGVQDYLYGVAAISVKNAWAVGMYSIQSTGQEKTLIEHWDGSNWAIVSSPNPGMNNVLENVVRIPGTNNLWAVGYTVDTTRNITSALIEYWNGISWKAFPSPNPGLQSGLYGLNAVSASDAWAVGFYTTPNGQTLIEHWNGSNWAVVSSPSPGTQGDTLYGITAISANNVWAVGTSSVNFTSEQALIEHWDGTSWSIIPSSNPTSINVLSDVVRGFPTSQLWAVGYTRSAIQQTLIERWNAKSWSVVNSPNLSTSVNGLNGITAISATNIWAVGSYLNTNDNAFQNLIEQWNGTNWNTISNPLPGWFSILQDISRVPGTNQLWTVGEYIPTQGANLQTLIEFYC